MTHERKHAYKYLKYQHDVNMNFFSEPCNIHSTSNQKEEKTSSKDVDGKRHAGLAPRLQHEH